MTKESTFRPLKWPLIVFGSVWVFHYFWLALFGAAADLCDLPGKATWWRIYLDTQSYFLGFSYALSLAFAAYAFQRFREQNSRKDGALALGGVTYSGILVAVGCFLIGCCGSPMLAVYGNFLGAAFLPFAKPLIAALTVLSVGIAWRWMERKRICAHCKISLKS